MTPKLDQIRHQASARVASANGFTLIEVLIVMEIIAIMLAIAVPSYVRFRQRALQHASAADVRAALPIAELYWSDPTKGNFTYKNMTLAALQAIDSTIKLDSVVVSTDFTTYCIQKTIKGYRSIAIRGLRATAGGGVQENVAISCPAAGSL